MAILNTSNLVIGKRYINAKSRRPLALLYIGPLPPQTGGETSGPSSSPIWLGVEYDDPTHGKGHSGAYNGVQIFQTRQEGAGAFIKVKTGDELMRGKTFVEAINERYSVGNGMESVVLGSSNAVVVEAPGMEGVSKRLSTLENLRQIGLEDELICGVGGTEDERRNLGVRLKGVRVLNISRNLMSTWAEVEEILEVVSGVTTLIMNDSRLDSKVVGKGQSRIKELHLARSLISWTEVAAINERFAGLEELHLSGNTSLAERPPNGGIRSDTLKFLSLDACGIGSWGVIEEASKLCSSLDSLNISSTPLGPMFDSSNKTSFDGLKSLILLDTTLDSFTSLANLSNRLPHLENLRFSLAPSLPQEAGTRLSGNAEEDRGTLLVLFPGLEMLNGNEVKAKEREEAERRFCSRHISFSEPNLQTLHQKLSAKHGLQPLPPAVPEKTSLRSKMITLHIYPASSEGFTLPMLPSAPVSMMKRKIGKKLGLSPEEMQMWTVKRTQGQIMGDDDEMWAREKVMEVGEGEVGYWFDDGDGVIVKSS